MHVHDAGHLPGGRKGAEMQITVRGNIRGFDVIESAVENAYAKLRGDSDYATLNMEDADGNILISEDDEDRGEYWLKDKLISAAIVSASPRSASSISTQATPPRQCKLCGDEIKPGWIHGCGS
ncbi:hypothetical protein ED208_12625 [Stagnimonas aquatica]|uniref:Uncharacterized protein n=2 Tax=Stagnimonas aquatica TaxID=2689987 RepID=A0A3N0V791_9GAMM|nr:hypothetical protein ED208_12625 [Stagnimonas aquatica]